MSMHDDDKDEGTTDDAGKETLRVDPHHDLTADELYQVTDRLVDFVNRRISKSEQEQEEAADEIFRVVFANDTALALGPSARTFRLYEAIDARAGNSLELDSEELGDYARIGALNQHLGREWKHLKFRTKELLIPLLRLPDGIAALKRGVKVANRSTTTRKRLKAWLAEQLPKRLGRGGRPRGATYKGVKTYVDRGQELLSDPEHVVEKIRAAPERERRALLRQMRELAEGMGKILAEFDSDD